MNRSIRHRGSVPVADIASGEIVRRGRPVRITGEFGERDAHAVVVTGGGVAEVSLVGETLVIDTSGLAIGGHTVLVNGIPAQGKHKGRQDAAFDVVVVDTPAALDEGLAVLHASRIRIGELDIESLPMDAGAEGQFRDIFKAVSRDGGEAVTLAFDQVGERIDIEEELAALSSRRRERYGRIEPALFEQLEHGGDVEVAVWASTRGIDLSTPEKSDKRPARKPSRSDARTRKEWTALGETLAEVAGEFGLVPERIDQAAPVVYGRMPADAVRRLAEHDLVAGVFRYDREGVDDLDDSIAIHNSDDAHSAGFTGAGVDVAVYEQGPDVTTNLAISGRFETPGAMSSHSRMTHGIIRNTERNRPRGHAPGANLFSANSYDLDAIRWAAQDEGCTVISQSFHRNAEQTSDSLSHDDNYKDWLALHWPYPTIVEAAGNGTSTEFVNHKGYNRLTVGSHDDNASAMASSSVFRNPRSSHGDRELPEIAGNGIGVTVVGLTDSGTSFAAPAVAGIAACVQEAAPLLRSWPEGTRAVLMAGAWRNPSGGRWRADLVAGVDGRDGAGTVDAGRSTSIAQSRQNRNNSGALRGFDVGTLRSSDLDGSGRTTFRYRITTPRTPLFFGSHVKVALAWDSKATRTDILFLSIYQNTLTVDLDLEVRDSSGSLVASSMSWDNSYEIAEFDAKAGETYDIRIRRWAGSDDVWFGIAWTQISTLFDMFGSVQTAPVFGLGG
ncbi:hypothetical protein ABIB15_002188 [Marisediminicola sp. UYEF4]|uniref:S8 family serine peptidase n=1 Tax=Marisediminicola sp. UYEF4 TaxID=1756384 RepID=UPI00339263B1